MSPGAANSKEDDLEKTIKLIMEHVEKESKRDALIKAEQTKNKPKQKFLDLKSIIKADSEVMLRSKKAANGFMGTSSVDETNDEFVDAAVAVEEKEALHFVDNVFAKLTTLFPLFVLSAAITGVKKPGALLWVNKGQLIPLMLSAVMMSMGMTLKTDDFTRVLRKSESSEDASFAAIPAGISCQYLIMPLTAFLIGSATLLPQYPAAFLGLVLVGSCPGGTASNLVALIAKADVALSVILTSLSTIMASVLTPLLVKTFVGSAISISGLTLCKATAQVVLLPVAFGMLVREKLPNVADFLGRYASFAGVVLVSLLCGGVVAQNASMTIGSGSNLLKKVILSVLGLHTVGFGVGYFASKKLFGLSERVSRTISIETGMQNSALAVVLARSVVGSDPTLASLASLACLPGAFSATVHSCLGSALAVYWRWADRRSKPPQA
jgi:BASS family bile acid:Na+ symporter